MSKFRLRYLVGKLFCCHRLVNRSFESTPASKQSPLPDLLPADVTSLNHVTVPSCGRTELQPSQIAPAVCPCYVQRSVAVHHCQLPVVCTGNQQHYFNAPETCPCSLQRTVDAGWQVNTAGGPAEPNANRVALANQANPMNNCGHFPQHVVLSSESSSGRLWYVYNVRRRSIFIEEYLSFL